MPPVPKWYDEERKPTKELPPAFQGAPSFINKAFWEKERTERFRIAVEQWAMYGFGVPPILGSIYVIKMLVFFCAFYFFILPKADTWIEALGRFAVLAVWIEGLGLSAGWGPLAGKTVCMTTAYHHFVRPGTIKLPSIPLFNPKANVLGLPCTRNILDVLAYIVTIGFATWLPFADTASTQRWAVIPGQWSPLPILIGMLYFGFADRTVYVAVRADYYLPYMIVFSFLPTAHQLAAAQWVILCVWLGAGLSKVGPWFDYVTGVMLSNSFTMRIVSIRRALYNFEAKSWANPKGKGSKASLDALPASLFCRLLTAFGAATEILFPTSLAIGGAFKLPGLVVGVLFHAYIMSNVPVAVPTEWNVYVVTVACFCFHPTSPDFFDGIGPMISSHPLVALAIAFICIFIPLLGNVDPSKVGFLCAYRYYAGNWPYNIYLQCQL